MLTKNDCLLLLAELQESGIDTQEVTSKLVKSTSIDLDVLKFINSNKPFEVLDFYRKLRMNYNNKKSKLYKSIVQMDEKEPKDIVVVISSLLTQIILHTKNVEDKRLFLKHARADELSKVLAAYFNTYDLTHCVSILKLVRADLKAFEAIDK